MLKKLFDWTPNDVAVWEKIRARGLGRFLLWYGVKLFGGGLFIFLGGAVLLVWVKDGVANIAALGLELLFVAAACLIGGLVNGLITWAVEESIYRKIIKRETGKRQE